MNPWIISTVFLLAVWMAGSGLLGALWLAEACKRGNGRDWCYWLVMAATWALWLPGWMVVEHYRNKKRKTEGVESFRKWCQATGVKKTEEETKS